MHVGSCRSLQPKTIVASEACHYPNVHTHEENIVWELARHCVERKEYVVYVALMY